MAQPAAFSPSDHDFEVSVNEARTRFVQLVRVASLTGRPVTITDHGRPMATLVPHQRNGADRPPGTAPPPNRAAPPSPGTGPRTPATAQSRSGTGAASPGTGGRSADTGGRSPDTARWRAEAERQAEAEAEGRRAESFRQAEAARQQSDPDRSQAVAAGWARRLEQVRATQQRQHAAEMASLARALADAWRVIDHLSPRGADPGIDRLRTEHHDFLPHQQKGSQP
ncbi:type II toxin-antitoxin system prevent-host-death family antitoxin [Actinoplanes sp. NPDC049596]|uniref:type II toxin-antitoxin system Phd/YefM family antitoxin n=1 Tax=unclassified Actinoplanes TaxID=2626549 RepID=UPI003418749E